MMPPQALDQVIKSTHQNCPYTRPHLTKPSNYPLKPISGPPQQDKLCPYNMLMLLISLNGIAQLHTSQPPSPSPSRSSHSFSFSRFQFSVTEQYKEYRKHRVLIRIRKHNFARNQQQVIASYVHAYQ